MVCDHVCHGGGARAEGPTSWGDRRMLFETGIVLFSVLYNVPLNLGDYSELGRKE